jgi:hypothetical protein
MRYAVHALELAREVKRRVGDGEMRGAVSDERVEVDSLREPAPRPWVDSGERFALATADRPGIAGDGRGGSPRQVTAPAHAAT